MLTGRWSLGENNKEEGTRYSAFIHGSTIQIYPVASETRELALLQTLNWEYLGGGAGFFLILEQISVIPQKNIFYNHQNSSKVKKKKKK